MLVSNMISSAINRHDFRSVVAGRDGSLTRANLAFSISLTLYSAGEPKALYLQPPANHTNTSTVKLNSNEHPSRAEQPVGARTSGKKNQPQGA